MEAWKRNFTILVIFFTLLLTPLVCGYYDSDRYYDYENPGRYMDYDNPYYSDPSEEDYYNPYYSDPSEEDYYNPYYSDPSEEDYEDVIYRNIAIKRLIIALILLPIIFKMFWKNLKSLFRMFKGNQSEKSGTICKKCWIEYSDNERFCWKCGEPLENEDAIKFEETIPLDRTTKQETKPTKLWYLAPLFLSILGGGIAYFAIRKRDEKMAKNMIYIGAIIFILSIMIR